MKENNIKTRIPIAHKDIEKYFKGQNFVDQNFIEK